MEQAELRELWAKHNHRPAFVLEHRDEIHEHTDTSEPIPESGMHAVRSWLKSYKGVVTRQLKPDSEDGGDGGDN